MIYSCVYCSTATEVVGSLAWSLDKDALGRRVCVRFQAGMPCMIIVMSLYFSLPYWR